MTKPLLLFYSYADEDKGYCEKLEQVLKPLQRQSVFECWGKQTPVAGSDWQRQIDENLDRADLILLLISPSFLASNSCHAQLQRARDRQASGKAQVILIQVRAAYDPALDAELFLLPRNGTPVASSANQDEVWREIVQELHDLVQQRPSPAPDPAVAPRQPPDGASTPPLALQQPEPLDALLDKLKAQVEKSLQTAPALVAALASRGYGSLAGDSPQRSIACALVDSPAQTLAHDLADLADELARERDRIRGLLWQLLPFATDWRTLLRNARSAPPGGAIELPLRSETVAEIVLAGIRGRSCRFAPGNLEFPLGATYIPLPAAAHAPFLDPQGQGLADALLGNLFNEQNLEAPAGAGRDPWRGIKKQFPDFAEFKSAAKGRIKTGPLRKDSHYYTLVIDKALSPQPTPDLDGSWALTKAALATALPGLHLVRLQGGTDELEDEGALVPFIKGVCDLS